MFGWYWIPAAIALVCCAGVWIFAARPGEVESISWMMGHAMHLAAWLAAAVALFGLTRSGGAGGYSWIDGGLRFLGPFAFHLLTGAAGAVAIFLRYLSSTGGDHDALRLEVAGFGVAAPMLVLAAGFLPAAVSGTLIGTGALAAAAFGFYIGVHLRTAEKMSQAPIAVQETPTPEPSATARPRTGVERDIDAIPADAPMGDYFYYLRGPHFGDADKRRVIAKLAARADVEQQLIAALRGKEQARFDAARVFEFEEIRITPALAEAARDSIRGDAGDLLSYLGIKSLDDRSREDRKDSTAYGAVDLAERMEKAGFAATIAPAMSELASVTGPPQKNHGHGIGWVSGRDRLRDWIQRHSGATALQRN